MVNKFLFDVFPFGFHFEELSFELLDLFAGGRRRHDWDNIMPVNKMSVGLG